LIVDPWGTIIAEADVEPGVVLARIDPAQVAKARAKVPSLTNGRRFELIEPAPNSAHVRVVRGAG
jgi:predicted amidohydrolase